MSEILHLRIYTIYCNYYNTISVYEVMQDFYSQQYYNNPDSSYFQAVHDCLPETRQILTQNLAIS